MGGLLFAASQKGGRSSLDVTDLGSIPKPGQPPLNPLEESASKNLKEAREKPSMSQSQRRQERCRFGEDPRAEWRSVTQLSRSSHASNHEQQAGSIILPQNRSLARAVQGSLQKN